MGVVSIWARLGLFGFVMVVVTSGAIVAVADEPMFVRWLVADDPGDETIRDYWERAEREELEPPALVDLGTMLFYRGYPKDAVRMYRKALDLDRDLYEAWFRIGLVEHSEGNFDNARQAYKRCLKKLTGHGWCNFYLGLLEEQLGHTSDAMYHYRRAFKFAPELADPKVNPEVLGSELVLGVHLQDRERRRFKSTLPIPYLEPKKVERVRRSYEPTPTPEPEKTPHIGPTVTPTGAEPQKVQPQATVVQPVRPPRPTLPQRTPTLPQSE
jgi:tetratricopeptide (TPR) repeat protein